ncbi:MAG: hypothetical protein JW850_18500 [Thermoflexales bacterium]|nr:hypothetical protein [Thermoflexales bacterium]
MPRLSAGKLNRRCSDEEVAVKVTEIDPHIAALVSAVDLLCMADDGEVDYGMYLHLVEASLYEMPQPETAEWVECAVAANPGVWMARLCRAMHGRRETLRDIAWCGTCACYSNRRRRARASRLPPATLPGYEKIGGAFALHPPCSRCGLTWLRRQVYKLRKAGRIVSRRECDFTHKNVI